MESFPLGGVITVLVLLPNLIAVFFPPLDALPTEGQGQDKLLGWFTVLERIGQMGCFILPFFYRVRFDSGSDRAAFVVMVIALALYYAGWIRYLLQGRAEALFYQPMLGVPLPMAVMPVIYFLAAAGLLGSVWLLLAAIVLGAGHLTVTGKNARNVRKWRAAAGA